MSYRVAINGFGRFGRNYLRCLHERELLGTQVDVIAVNDLWEPATLAHLLEYDSTFGRLRAEVTHDETSIGIDRHRARAFRERDPGELPWTELGVELVIESTGRFRGRADAGAHLKTGAGRVLISAPVENGSICDLSCELSVPATVAEVNAAFAAAAAGGLAGVLRYAETPIVSRDIVGDPASCVFDAGLTQAAATTVKVFGWYDNEWGYTHRLVDLTTAFAATTTHAGRE